MPHHESGLLALRTKDPAVIDRAVAFFRKSEPDHAIELVRVDGGKAVLLTFGSVLKPGDSRQNVDVSLFLDDRAMKRLAKQLGQRIWVGHAYGGYTNAQTAMEVAPSGKLEWSSEYDFGIPKELRKTWGDPFTDAKQRHACVLRARRENGYGRIGEELGFDYFRVIDIEAGDALFAKDKRRLGESAAEHAAWLKAPFRAPEGRETDGAKPSRSADQVALRWLDASTPPAPVLASALAELAAHQKVKAAGLRLEVAARGKKETVCLVTGPAVKRLSSTMLEENFVELSHRFTGGSLFVFAQRGKEQWVMTYGAGNDPLLFMREQRTPLKLKGLKLKSVKVEATAEWKKQLTAAREAAIAQLDADDEDEEDDLFG